MKPILSILLSALSLSAFAQHVDLIQATPQRVKAIIEKQMSTHAVNKTTGTAERLIGYSSRSFPGNTLIDTMHAAYSNGRGVSYPSCRENMYGYRFFGQPDTIWENYVAANSYVNDLIYLYDSHDYVLSKIDKIKGRKDEYILDAAGNAVQTKSYKLDTINGTLTYDYTNYSSYDNQNRDVYDSSWHGSKLVSVYGSNGIDSTTSYSWDTTGGVWKPLMKVVYGYNALGRVTLTRGFSWNVGDSAWFYFLKDTGIYNNNGWLISYVGMTNSGSTVWDSSYKFIYNYAGNGPLYNYVESYTKFLNHWAGVQKDSFSLNSAGNWDYFIDWQWDYNALTWGSASKHQLVYNSFDLVDKLDIYNFNSTTNQFEISPSNTAHYYYEEYNPTAVTTIYTASPEITASPNPVSGKLHVDGNIGSKNVSMQIISITGARLFNTSGNWQSMNKDIDMSSFANGVYYLLITDNNGNKIAAKQIVKN
ncbi:T9SS type A sorting domain-containing protein [Taibaiella soli]|uniref:Secretion system C-terminal sorting domain-containing protein n=1 Tax=Taibaiella soli TaxID=1649169 RepID=A0A2W2BE25_9BACT|nr:T9SS type A sorting domain-containing protein [Taibaiella soli]PZF74519.1 hypothetical protein DN068_02790 [Taibaiella soli]